MDERRPEETIRAPEGTHETRELESLRHENAKLKKVVADLTLDRHILRETIRKKT